MADAGRESRDKAGNLVSLFLVKTCKSYSWEGVLISWVSGLHIINVKSCF